MGGVVAVQGFVTLLYGLKIQCRQKWTRSGKGSSPILGMTATAVVRMVKVQRKCIKNLSMEYGYEYE